MSANAKTSTPVPDAERSELLQEFVDSRGTNVRIDRAASVLQGVKLLGLASRNGRRYREQALRRAITLYEGAKVNVNHPEGDPLAPRDYRDRIGVIRGVKHVAGQGLFGALHFNPKHPLAEQLVWDAEHAPENVGFSHNVLARTSRDSHGLVVEAIDKVRSVDLVADPATTSGLFEQAAQAPRERSKEIPWDQLALHDLELHRPDLLADLAEQHQAELACLQEKIEQTAEREAFAVRRQRVTELLVEHGLPLPWAKDPVATRLTSELFLESLDSAPDDASLVELIADRAQAVGEAKHRAGMPRSREQTVTTNHAQSPTDAFGFVEAITKP